MNTPDLPELRLLTHNERAMLAAQLAHPTPRDTPGGERTPLPPTRKTLQQTFQVSSGSFERARQVVRHGTDTLRTLTASGRVRLTTAARVAQLPPDAQERFVTRVHTTGIDPRRLARPDEHLDTTPVLTRREARYRWIQESALRVMSDNFDALAMVVSTADGLDPALTPDQAAHWRSDLVRRSKPFRQLMSLLKERSG